MVRKIATCCYCGTRAVMVFDEGRHELACGACGAPLHEMKMMPQASDAKELPRKKNPVGTQAERRRGRPVAPRPDWHGDPDPRRRKKRHKKKRKPIFGRVLDEFWDVVEDIID